MCMLLLVAFEKRAACFEAGEDGGDNERFNTRHGAAWKIVNRNRSNDGRSMTTDGAWFPTKAHAQMDRTGII
jgi:hypothetical protein